MGGVQSLWPGLVYLDDQKFLRMYDHGDGNLGNLSFVEVTAVLVVLYLYVLLKMFYILRCGIFGGTVI